MAKNLEIKKEVVFYAKLLDKKGYSISYNDYWVNPSSFSDFSALQERGKTKLLLKSKEIEKTEKRILIQAEIKNNSKHIATGVKINVRDRRSESSLLPVYVSDGYFNLLPGECKRINIEIPRHLGDKEFYLSSDEWIR